MDERDLMDKQGIKVHVQAPKQFGLNSCGGIHFLYNQIQITLKGSLIGFQKLEKFKQSKLSNTTE